MRINIAIMNIGPILMLALMSAAIGDVQAETSGPFTDSHGPAPTAWNTTLSIPQFNAGLGALDSVSIVFSSSLQGSGTVTNNDATSNTVTVTIQAVVDLNLPTGVSGAPMTADVSEQQTFPNMPPAPTPGSTETVAIAGGGFDSRTYSAAADLAAFTGGGIVTFASSASSTEDVDGGPNIAYSIITDVGVAVEVNYEYGTAIFRDGFESGGTAAWSMIPP